MEPLIRLTGARVALSARHSEFLNLAIRRARILPFDSKVEVGRRYDLTGHLLLPGLINIHDHLEFNLFPRLGRGPYPNASEWAAAVHRPNDAPVQEHLRVAKAARLTWGGIKNLLSGVTTVAHHNPWEPRVFARGFPIRVLRKFGWAHSLAFTRCVSDAHKETPAEWPFIMHAAEGTDERARSEIRSLDCMGVLGETTILVHAIGATERDIETMRQRSVCVAWCPSSNLFTIGATLPSAALRSDLTIALGTDSAMTAEGDLIDEMRVARKEGKLTPEQLYPLVTTNAARALRLGPGHGEIRERGVADLIAVRDHGQTPAQALADLHPEMVMIGGRVMLLSAALAGHSRAHYVGGLNRICIQGRGQWLIRADVPDLYAEAVRELGPEIRLAGRRVCP
jgi:cytosine/adenosine deaminase-related metal-dependent hydrolase